MAVRWLLGSLALLSAAGQAGPLAWSELLISAAFWVVMTAILVRVIASWLGAGRYNRWIRPFYRLTDWIIEPIRRRLQPRGMIDFSPLLAYLLLFLLRAVIFSLYP